MMAGKAELLIITNNEEQTDEQQSRNHILNIEGNKAVVIKYQK